MAYADKPRLGFWQIWNMSFGFLGIQLSFALQNANVSRIFETLGACIDAIPVHWIAAPATGLLVQPIIGYMSDRTNSWMVKMSSRGRMMRMDSKASTQSLGPCISSGPPPMKAAAGSSSQYGTSTKGRARRLFSCRIRFCLRACDAGRVQTR